MSHIVRRFVFRSRPGGLSASLRPAQRSMCTTKVGDPQPSAPTKTTSSSEKPPTPVESTSETHNKSHPNVTSDAQMTTTDTKAKAKTEYYSPLLADKEKKKIIDRMVRVDHAGELGARQIYAGQLAVFRGTPVGSVIQHMADQEVKHLSAFDRLIVERRVRPTAMLPVWNAAGYALGLGTALIGKEAAMACTVAVEEVIAQHYNDQVRTLLEWEDEEELRKMFREFRDDELEHKDTGILYDAEKAPFYRAMSGVIKAGCRAAIAISEKV